MPLCGASLFRVWVLTLALQAAWTSGEDSGAWEFGAEQLVI